MPDRTEIAWDRPDESQIKLLRLLPLVHRDDGLEIDGRSYLVRSATISVESSTGDIVLYIRLRGTRDAD